jgi:hypothetical protein
MPPGDPGFRCASRSFTALGASRAPQEIIGCKPTMHFRFYLMIAALLLIGIEAAYSLYQLASFVL